MPITRHSRFVHKRKYAYRRGLCFSLPLFSSFVRPHRRRRRRRLCFLLASTVDHVIRVTSTFAFSSRVGQTSRVVDTDCRPAYLSNASIVRCDIYGRDARIEVGQLGEENRDSYERTCVCVCVCINAPRRQWEGIMKRSSIVLINSTALSPVVS